MARTRPNWIDRMKGFAGKERAVPVLALLLGAGAVVVTSVQSAESTARDFTVFVFSDIHLGAENLKAKEPFTKEETFAKVRAQLNTIVSLPGRGWPDAPKLRGLELGTVAHPKGLFILGDLTDGHKEPARQLEQWQSFESLFPVRGVAFGESLVPAFACAGNHDSELQGPQRTGLAARNRTFDNAWRLAALSSNGVHFALDWEGVHFISLNLCPANTTDAETPFKYGKPGPGSWNDPQGALSFLRSYLNDRVGTSGAPVILMHHYGFDGFSMNDWNWWTPQQRRALYELLKDYNVAVILHGHNHHAEHYRWPNPKQHASGDLDLFCSGKPPENPRHYDVLSCGITCWAIRIRGDQIIAAHFKPSGWTSDASGYFVKSLRP